MKPGGGALKGSHFERSICRSLTTWHDPKRKKGKPELFWRSATSGAKATVDRKAGRRANQGGDIIAVEDEALGTDHFWFTQTFSVECKDRADYGNLDLLFYDRGDFLKWWYQCTGDAEKAEKLPLLIFKRLRKDIMIAHWRHPFINEPLWYMSFSRGLEDVIIISRFSDWLEVNDPWELKAMFGPPMEKLVSESKGKLKRLG